MTSFEHFSDPDLAALLAGVINTEWDAYNKQQDELRALRGQDCTGGFSIRRASSAWWDVLKS